MMNLYLSVISLSILLAGTTNARRHDLHGNKNTPPDHTKYVAMARYIMHNADWTSIATVSSTPAIKGFPFANIKSMSDGPINNSTGVPYFYLTPLDFSAKDLMKDRRCTITSTLKETDFCEKMQYDAEDPRCATIIITGHMKALKNNTAEYEFGRNALFERHPSMANYPIEHKFFVAKLKIIQIAVIDWFGGAEMVPVSQYYSFNYTETFPTTLLSRSAASQRFISSIRLL